MTKTLRVDLADLEGIPHASGPSGTSVVVTAEYTSPVILASDGKIILAPKSKTMGASGRVDFDGIYASDSEDVREDHRGFAVRVKVAIREPNGATRTWARTVKPLEYMTATVRLGRMPSAEGLPAQWVSVDEVIGAANAAVTAAEAAKTQAQSAATSAQESVTLAQQAQAAALEVPDANMAAILANPATETGTYALMLPRYVPGGQPGGQQGTAGANSVGGFTGNVIADDVSGAVIVGGGTATSSGPGYANVIGRGIPANVGTGNPNYDTADLTKLRGTNANVSFILGGYDNLASGLASMIASQHGYIAEAATHAAIYGGSYHKILAGDYSVILGGTQSTVEGGLSQVALGRGIVMKGAGYNLASGINHTVDGQGATALGSSHTVGPGANFSTALGVLHNISAPEATAIGRQHTITGSGSTAIGRENTTSGLRAIAIGELNQATGAQAIAMGLRSVASGPNSYAHGRDAVASVDGQEAFATGYFNNPGDAQASKFTLRTLTTDASSTVIGTNGNSIGQWLRLNSAVTFEGTVIAYDPSTTDTKAWKVTGTARQGASGAAVLVAPAAVTVINETAGASAWNTAAVPGTRSITLRAIGEAGRTLRWSAVLETVEVGA